MRCSRTICADVGAVLYVHKGESMTVLLQPNAERALADGVGEALSPEADKQSIELAFLQRVSRTVRDAATAVLGAAETPASGDSFSATYARMRSPVFETILQALEHTVPKDAGFGRFRGSK